MLFNVSYQNPFTKFSDGDNDDNSSNNNININYFLFIVNRTIYFRIPFMGHAILLRQTLFPKIVYRTYPFTFLYYHLLQMHEWSVFQVNFPLGSILCQI